MSIDRNVKREIILRTVADAAWNLNSSLPFELDEMVTQGVVTLDEIVSWFRIEVEKQL